MKNERKEQIIKAALKRFVKHGLHKTTLDEIARDMRIGKATLYYYFSSKDELYQKTVLYETAKYITEIKKKFSCEDKSLSEKTEDYFRFKEDMEEKFVLLNRLIQNAIQTNLLDSEKTILAKLIKDESVIIKNELSLNENISSSELNNSVDKLVTNGWGKYLYKVLKLSFENNDGIKED